MKQLPRRDALILPLLSLLTLGILLSVAELAARVFWPEHLQDSCAVPDKALGLRFRPNCKSEVKGAETIWLENTYNACGYRSAESCGPKPDQGFRVAVIGSSISSGYMVPYSETFSARASAALRERCHTPVDFQNMAVPGVGLETATLHLDAALALRPNVVLMALSAHDMEVLGPVSASGEPENIPAAPPAPAVASPSIGGGMLDAVRRLAAKVRDDPAVKVAQHFLYQNLDSYLPLYLQHRDEADYLRAPLTAAWQDRLARFDREIGLIALRTHADGSNFLLVFVPSRAQALLQRWRLRPPDVDPALLGKQLANIARHYGVNYIDLTETIGDRADVADLYYSLDSHPNSAASAVIARAVVNALLKLDGLPDSCRQQIGTAQ